MTKALDNSKGMQAPLHKLVTDMKPEDWLKIYVISEVNNFETKFPDIKLKNDIDEVCDFVATLNLPEGSDVFCCLIMLFDNMTEKEDIHNYDCTRKLHGLTLGEDVLIYVYSRYCELEGYNPVVAYMFKQSLQYTIPF